MLERSKFASNPLVRVLYSTPLIGGFLGMLIVKYQGYLGFLVLLSCFSIAFLDFLVAKWTFYTFLVLTTTSVLAGSFYVLLLSKEAKKRGSQYLLSESKQIHEMIIRFAEYGLANSVVGFFWLVRFVSNESVDKTTLIGWIQGYYLIFVVLPTLTPLTIRIIYAWRSKVP